ncbi:MAG: DUF4301 family protein [Bacteroides sp.]|nr:DUF4301 family protein [Bacteroides sp.]
MQNLSPADRQQMQRKGISEESLQKQLDGFKTGFPFARLVAPALVGQGVQTFSASETERYRRLYREAAKKETVLKFVPASGAATRMFKNLYAFYQKCREDGNAVPEADVQAFFDNLPRFAFYRDLQQAVQRNTGKSMEEAVAQKQYAPVLECLLEEKGLCYGHLPKALLLFHRYATGAVTALEEHLAEAALYAASDGVCHLHFTLSPEHREAFSARLDAVQADYEKRYGLRYDITVSEQKSSTDTVAVTMDNEIFRDAEGRMVFRPGGHGALIENLNEQQAGIVFIKNIDNITTQALRADTQTYKELLAGVLVERRDRVFAYLRRIEDMQQRGEAPSEEFLRELEDFARRKLSLRFAEGFSSCPASERLAALRQALDRPMRVCGVVKNTGEPGGGPFWVLSQGDGAPSLQIVESSQVDMNDPEQKKIFETSGFFNPVDLICAPYDYRYDKFDLTRFIDPQTAFISLKSVQGTDIKAMELPGLWNGAMARWITLFVEVPDSVFTPVKTVNDLLRPQHQAE